MRTLIALDLETTGLDPDRDAVIEIGAVRFTGPRVEDEWSTLVNPGRPLPPEVAALTGINDDMLAGAPRLQSVIPDLHAFVGDRPILGHNIAFDLAFLSRQNLFTLNDSLDTYDLATVMMPAAGRYGLASLARELGVPLGISHRALEDAHATRQVFLRLYARALELPEEVLAEIARLGAEVKWGADWIFDSAYDERNLIEREPIPPFTLPFKPWEAEHAPLRPLAEPKPLDVDEVAALLEPGGPLAEAFPGYEHRPQQISMARAVAEAFSQGDHLLVEAGTGTGKSIAYLLPAFHWAEQNGARVVISTNTLNLQDQLIHKDVPDLNRALGAAYRAAVLKGRANYLCPRRLAALRRIGPRSAEEMRVLAKVLVWLSQGGTGDRGELNIPLRESGVWARLSAESEDCTIESCQRETGGICPYFRARQAADDAHVVIVNHALLLADIATGNRVIPEYNYLIVDEAHHLESAVTNGLRFSVTERDVGRTLGELGGRSRGLLRLVRGAAAAELEADQLARVDEAIESISERAGRCVRYAATLFKNLGTLMENRREGKPLGPYGQQIRIMPSTRTLPDWEHVEVAWEDLRTPLEKLIGQLNDLSDALEAMAEAGAEAAGNLAVATHIARRSLTEIFANLDHMIFEPDKAEIYWMEVRPRGDSLALHAAPLDIGPLVERYLWHEKASVIMTSATLTTAGEFDYLRRRLHADEAEELALGSPFDFESSTLIYLPTDMPEPNDRHAYQRALESALRALLTATSGRALVLFTSNRHLQQTARALAEPLGRAGVHLLEQTSGASRHTLLESFRTEEAAALFGTRSFWEGVDVPGPALSVLAIVRLPFDVPSDPIIAARAELFEDPFHEYMVPEAILRFRQGFGRLIRTRSDRGVVVLFDRRVTSKSYGRAFLDSLPRCTVRPGPLAGLPEAAARWLNL